MLVMIWACPSCRQHGTHGLYLLGEESLTIPAEPYGHDQGISAKKQPPLTAGLILFLLSPPTPNLCVSQDRRSPCCPSPSGIVSNWNGMQKNLFPCLLIRKKIPGNGLGHQDALPGPMRQGKRALGTSLLLAPRPSTSVGVFSAS